MSEVDDTNDERLDKWGREMAWTYDSVTKGPILFDLPLKTEPPDFWLMLDKKWRKHGRIETFLYFIRHWFMRIFARR